MSKQRIVVNIFNEQYVLKADLAEERVQKLAEQVDQRMRKITDLQPSLSSTRVAVLVALELADEANNSKAAYENILTALKEEQAPSFSKA